MRKGAAGVCAAGVCATVRRCDVGRGGEQTQKKHKLKKNEGPTINSLLMNQ